MTGLCPVLGQQPDGACDCGEDDENRVEDEEADVEHNWVVVDDSQEDGDEAPGPVRGVLLHLWTLCSRHCSGSNKNSAPPSIFPLFSLCTCADCSLSLTLLPKWTKKNCGLVSAPFGDGVRWCWLNSCCAAEEEIEFGSC